MIIDRTGDLFTSGVEAIGHGVNCAGEMQHGIAATIAQTYGPAMFGDYAAACASGDLRPGNVRLWAGTKGLPLLVNMATQRDPGANARLPYIHQAVRAALAAVEDLGIYTLAIPRIGAGVGGLSWAAVRKTLEESSAGHDATLEIWTLPQDARSLVGAE